MRFRKAWLLQFEIPLEVDPIRFRKYPPNLKERAARLVMDARDGAGGRRGVYSRVGQQLRIPVDTLRGWVHRADVDQELRAEATGDDVARLAAFEREA